MNLLDRLLPAPLHRVLIRLAHAARTQVWKLRRSSLDGVRVLALDPQGRVLLVRHSYGSDKWMPPGGGMKRGEDPVPTGARELLEETACTLHDGRLIAVSGEDLHGARNFVNVVAGHTRDTPVADRREIIEARFFALDALPEHMSPRLRSLVVDWLVEAGLAEREAGPV